MDYSKVYRSLIANAASRITDPYEYYEVHHITPSSMGGSDDPSNLVKLTAREHYIAHWLLVKIYKNYKMASAFNNMCMRDSNQKREFSSRQFETARKYFSKYHPCKEDSIKSKISSSLKEYYKNLDPYETVLKYGKVSCELKFCESCGSYMSSVNSEYVNTHPKTRFCSESCLGKHKEDTGYYKKLSDSHKKRLSALTREQMSDRMKNSVGRCDQVAKGEKISATKKLEKHRISNMTDDEFLNFISNMKLYRSDGLRNGNVVKYLKMKGVDVDEYYENFRI